MTTRFRVPQIVRAVNPGGVIRGNSAFTELLGHTNEELSEQSLLEWIHPEDRPSLKKTLEAGAGTASARHFAKSGDWISLEWKVRVEGEDTYALGQLPARDANMTPADLPHAVAQGSTNAMLESMALIVESKNPGMKCSILLVDRTQGRVTVGAGPSLDPDYNEAVEGLQIGPSVGSCGTAAYWNVPVVVENIAEDPLWRNLRDAAKIAGVCACWSQPILATNGEVLGAMALYDTKPSAPERYQMDGLEIAARMVGLAIERARLEETLGQAMKMDALGVLASGVAHDFNNVLAVVLGNAELALEGSIVEPKMQRMLHAIITAAESAAALCNQMLAYAGRASLLTEAVECNSLIAQISELLRVTLSKKATLELDLNGRLGAIADSSQLRQVLMNLITNASDAIGNNEGKIVISTSARELGEVDVAQLDSGSGLAPGKYIQIVVRDTGCGMSAETQSKIFDPFFTTKPGGRGLGMAAVRGIVHAHNGAILFESEEGEGTTFTVLLPQVSVAIENDPVSVEMEECANGARVLVVDDEPAVLEVVSKMLAHAGMEVTQACDGQQAIDIFRRDQKSIDCVLLDLNMPRFDGEEVFKELKSIQDDVRVVLSSGFTEREVLARFRGAGVAGAVQKPVKMKSLLAKVHEAVNSR